MNILITGGAGFIASHIADAYIQAGHNVTIVDNLSTGIQKNIPQQAQFFPIDIRSLAELEKIFTAGNFDIINHHAAQIDVRKSVTNPIYDAEVNIIGTINLLELSRKYTVKKLIFASTGGAIYGEGIDLPADETHPINPECPYGASKRTAEVYIELYARLYGLNYLILRYPNIYGPRQNPKGEAGVNAIFIGQMLAGKTPTIFGDGTQQRDYVYIEDVVQANLIALRYSKNGTYNLGWGIGISVNEIYQKLQEIIGFKNPATYAPPRAGEIQRIYLDSQKAQTDLGWNPQYDFVTGLTKTVEWFRSNPNWYG
ncbi:MAG: NAD-dependent epimerase/dehydratase family protein [bacterium]|nr:NAD-dependent epimerase/dehydratase family protein [bacterium]